MIKLETPLTIEKVESLRVGDQVLLSGTIYTGRDAAHKRFVEAINNNEPLPFDPYDQVIYFVGPTPTKPGHIIGSCGPTTSYRMDAYSPTMLSKGLRGMIGKGRRNYDVKEAMKQYKGVYFGAIGGAGAIIASCIKSCEIIAYEDLGPEAVRRLVVEDLPLTVVIDSEGHDLYEIGIKTDRYEAFTKNAYIFNKEKNTNLALILSTSWHNQDAMYGRKLYNVDQTNTYASLMFETEFNPQNSFSAGLSFNYDAYDQHYRLNNNADTPLKASDKEAVPGAYVQYTLNLNDQWMLMAGLRGDYSSKHGFFVTPRAHLKYNPNDYVHFRLSAGKGYRTNHVLAENNYLLSSSRKVEIAKNLDMEEAWNLGASVSTYIPVFGKTLNVNAEYYYTDFRKQVVVDMDSNPHEVAFYNLDGRSYSHVFQVEASYPFFKGFTLTGAYRLTDAQTTYKGQRMEKPLTGKYKGLLTASYQTPLGIWQFDATLQLNGGGRMPAPYELADGQLSWSRRYGSFEQLSMQVTRYFRRWSIYVGGENLTNFKQKNPIIDAANPWGDNFDSTMIWGPVHGAKAYVGIRFNLARNGE